MTEASQPPRIAEAILRISLAPADRESVSGDLLEEYRESILPSRSRLRADLWYAGQVNGFVWRTYGAPALALLVVILARTALDWLVPTTDFTSRATASTVSGFAILTIAGFKIGRRSQSPWAGTLAGIVIPLASAPFIVAAVLILLALNHDRATMANIQASGGLGEALTLPIMLAIPGALAGTVGGALASVARRLT